MTAQDPRPGHETVTATVSSDLGRSESVLPDRASEDTDEAWGDYPERDDDRLYRDRPPHWDDF
jgi:hypothetical protein